MGRGGSVLKKRMSFRYQLTKWQKKPQDLYEVVKQLEEYNEPYALKEKKKHFAIFTRGLNIKKEKNPKKLK